jgi:hypothetical protein
MDEIDIFGLDRPPILAGKFYIIDNKYFMSWSSIKILA